MWENLMGAIVFITAVVICLYITRLARWSHLNLQGEISIRRERKWLWEDLKRARKSIYLVIGRGYFNLWDGFFIRRQFKKAIRRGVKITFIIGQVDRQRFNELQGFLGDQAITIRLLAEQPDNTYRLVDDIGTHTFYPVQAKFLWTKNHGETAEEQKSIIKSYLQKCISS